MGQTHKDIGHATGLTKEGYFPYPLLSYERFKCYLGLSTMDTDAVGPYYPGDALSGSFDQRLLQFNVAYL